jgi:folate-dependent tRNA-U54 methylase TrmFO/GidA
MISDWQELFYVDAALVGVELENSPKVLLDYFGPRLNNNFHRAHPITGIAGYCARAARGHAAAPPSSVMNSRLSH